MRGTGPQREVHSHGAQLRHIHAQVHSPSELQLGQDCSLLRGRRPHCHCAQGSSTSACQAKNYRGHHGRPIEAYRVEWRAELL
jgi:hypothetical protein